MKLLRGAIVALALVSLLALVISFWDFAASAHRAAPPLPKDADGVVSLTGGSVERLTTGMQLLSEGYGRRLLISGVNPKVTDKEMKVLIGGAEQTFDCCVDLGRGAEDTLGNASETAAWAKRYGMRKIIVVTDDYHMPRTLLELRIAMPLADLVPHPIATRVTAPGAWLKSPDVAMKLAAEYAKYLTIRARELLLAGEQKRAEANA